MHSINKYHKKFLEAHSAENIICLFSRYRGAAKEITESMGMLEAATKFVDDVGACKVIVIGDGCSPRTGAVFSYFTKAEVISIDPNLNMDHWNEHVAKQTAIGLPPQRLTVLKDRAENVKIGCGGKPCIVIWPHSHAPMGKEQITDYSSRVDIAMPCCVPIPAKFMDIPHIAYTDRCILTEKRTIHVWR